MDFQSYRELGLRTFPLVDKRNPLIKRWQHVKVTKRWEEEYPDANIAMVNDRVTVIDVDDLSYVDVARELFGPTPIEVKTRKGLHLWYKSSGETRRIRPLVDGDHTAPIDVLGQGGYTMVPKSDGYSFVRGGLADVANLPPILDAARALLERPATEQKGPVEPREYKPSGKVWEEMGEGSGRNDALFAKACELAVRAESEEDLYAYVAAANARFAEPLPDREVASVTGSAWSRRGTGRHFSSARPGYGVTHEVYDALRGNPDAVALLCELLRQHNWRQGNEREFVLGNALAEHIGLSRPRFLNAMQTLEAKGQLVVTNAGGRHKGDVRKAKLLV